MRIVTWNINGLRAVTKRGFGDLATLLDSLKADIVCFQETKLTRAELGRDLALIDGWDSYFSHCKDRSYSGVATYCKKTVTVPIAAEAGITGVLQSNNTDQRSFPRQVPGCYEELCNRFTQEELLAIDLEGRCVITDHDAFILFNLYGPAITSEESAADRFAYKMQLYQALQCRMEACLAAGRSVILVGDLNICPQPIDSCEPGDLSKFRDRADKKWLSSVMKHSGGYFVDLFRHFHPNRQEVYSCWSTASGARVNNYGARIDLILLAEPQLSAEPQMPAELQNAAASAVSPWDAASIPASCQLHHSNAALPVLGELASSQGIALKSSSSLLQQCQDCGVWMDMQGSDHAPVWADWNLAAPLPTPEAAPPLSTRYMFTGKQPKLTAWLGAVATGPSSKPMASAQADPPSQPPPALPYLAGIHHAAANTAPPTAIRANSLGTAAVGGQLPSSISITRKGSGMRAGGGKQGGKAGQTSLRAFMRRPPAATVNAATAPNVIMQQSCLGALKPGSATSLGDSTPAGAGLLGVALPARASYPEPQEATMRQSDAGPASSSGAQVSCQQLGQECSELSSLGSVPNMRIPEEFTETSVQIAIASGLKRNSSPTGEVDMQQHPAGTCRAAALLSGHQQAAIEPGAKLDDVKSSQSNVSGSQTSVSAASDAGKAAVTAAWSKIQSKMKAPKCRGHSEDCVIREVKKNGPNKGRLFYVCRRADGKPPQGRCDHFEWVGNRTTRGQPNAINAHTSNKRLKGS